ncbi:hypothetical protein C8R45DRAFT_935763 [Mycena sanguinolenta]|nr:hypothetical protein C8R45DRAFT_935763 [Mycena sanguinolenta]
MVPPRGAVHRGVATPLAGQKRPTTIARLPARPASHPTATTNYNGNDVPPPRYGIVPTDGFTAGTAIGNLGTGGGGSSAPGTHQPDDRALSRGDMAEAHLNLRGAPVLVLVRIKRMGRIKGTIIVCPPTMPHSMWTSNPMLQRAIKPWGRIKHTPMRMKACCHQTPMTERTPQMTRSPSLMEIQGQIDPPHH